MQEILTEGDAVRMVEGCLREERGRTIDEICLLTGIPREGVGRLLTSLVLSGRVKPDVVGVLSSPKWRRTSQYEKRN